MNIQCGVPGSDRLPPAYRRAANLRRDLGRAIGLYGLGDRSELVLKTLALGKVSYDEIGADVPRPLNVRSEEWRSILDSLVTRFGFHPYGDAPAAA